MPDVQIEFAPWPVGTTVRVYQRKSELVLSEQPPPGIASPASGVVASDNTLTLTAVPVGEWWAIGQDTPGHYRYVALVL